MVSAYHAGLRVLRQAAAREDVLPDPLPRRARVFAAEGLRHVYVARPCRQVAIMCGWNTASPEWSGPGS